MSFFLKLGHKLARLMFIVFLCIAIFNAGAFYGEYKQPLEGIYSFFSRDRVYAYDSDGRLPEPALAQIGRYNSVINMIWYALFFMFLYLVLDYFVDPKHHFFYAIRKKLRRFEHGAFSDNDRKE